MEKNTANSPVKNTSETKKLNAAALLEDDPLDQVGGAVSSTHAVSSDSDSDEGNEKIDPTAGHRPYLKPGTPIG